MAQPGAGRAEFRRWTVRRQRLRATAAVGTVAAVTLLGLGAVQWTGGDRAGVAPPPADREPPTVQETTGGAGCDHERITCLGGDRYTVHLDVETTWTLTEGFDTPYSWPEPTGAFVQSYFRGGEAGVAVIHHVGAGARSSGVRPVAGVDEAEELIDWISERPFLDASSVERTQLGSDPAWTVEAAVADPARARQVRCDAPTPCYPVLHWADDPAERVNGVQPGMTARYTALDLHGSGITVVWSWSRTGEIPPAVEQAAQGVRFE